MLRKTILILSITLFMGLLAACNLPADATPPDAQPPPAAPAVSAGQPAAGNTDDDTAEAPSTASEAASEGQNAGADAAIAELNDTAAACSSPLDMQCSLSPEGEIICSIPVMCEGGNTSTGTGSAGAGTAPAGGNTADEVDIFNNARTSCLWTGGRWFDFPPTCEWSGETAKALCTAGGGKWVQMPDNTYDCQFPDGHTYHQKICTAIGGVYIPETVGCKVSRTASPTNSPFTKNRSFYNPNNERGNDVIVNWRELCIRLGGQWQEDSQTPCTLDPEKQRAICDELGGQWIEDEQHSYCKRTTHDIDEANHVYRQLCQLVNGTFVEPKDIYEVPQCLVPETIADKCIEQPYLPECNVISIDPDLTPDCDANPSACGSATLNNSTDDDTATMDPCANNPNDPTCTNTVDSSLQVDCDADPSACGSMTLDEGSGGSSGGSSSGDDTATIDPCVQNPSDPSCNTVDLGGSTDTTLDLGSGSDITTTVDCNLYPTDPSCNTVVEP